MPDIKFIADVNVEKPIVEYLSRQGYDIKWIPDINCEMTDDELLELANKEKRILITNDKDFGELIFLQKKLTTGIVLFRLKIQKSQEKMKLMKKLLMGYREKLFKHFIVITKDRIRIIPVGDRT